MYPVHWSLKVSFRYKKNAINRKLHRATNFPQIFHQRQLQLKQKFLKVGFPHKVIENTINNLNNNNEELMIPRQLFDERKIISINVPVSNKNEHFSKKFCEKFYRNGKVKFNIIWATRKIKSLIKIKDNVKHLGCVVYQGICTCGNRQVKWSERQLQEQMNTNNQTINQNLLNT